MSDAYLKAQFGKISATAKTAAGKVQLPASGRGINSKLMSQLHATGSPQRRIA